MVKENELRIGSVVGYNSKEYKVTTINLYDPTTRNYQIFISDANNTESTILQYLDGIELSETILSRCGFTWNNISKCYVNKDNIDIVKNEGTYADYYLWHNNGMVGKNPIRYIHQLQNLYLILTGRDLII